MKNDVVFDSVKTKFKFVKPLYRRNKHVAKDKMKILPITFDSSINLGGDDIRINRTLVTNCDVNKINVNRNIKAKGLTVSLPGVCEPSFSEQVSKLNKNYNINTKKECKDQYSMFDANKYRYKKMIERDSEHKIDQNVKGTRKLFENDKPIVLHKISDTWLRVYPVPKTPDESVCSVIIRCIFCQLGLIVILVIWNVIWVFVIHYFEGPEEIMVSLDFEKEQNQLVINLATELRQITPVSLKWRDAIEKRIEDERQLTMLAVQKGAKLNPGLFWDLPGTFLFSVYVMTALGFGAPVPHTVWGRTSAFVYALIAVPTHIYLMWNATTCILVNAEQCSNILRENFKGKGSAITKKIAVDTRGDSRHNHNSKRDNDLNKGCLHKTVCRFGIFCGGRYILLLVALYYICGVLAFGVLRDRAPFEVIMFPLEFTTTGGLESVKGHVRILYGFYVEGAMCLLACILANFRRISSNPVASILEKYRLFQSTRCTECKDDDICIRIQAT